MSIRKVSKILKNISKFADAYSDKQNPFFREKTKDYGKAIQDRLIDGLVRGHDVDWEVDGRQFEGLKDSTMEVRQRRGVSGKSPLRAGGGIESFLHSDNLLTTGTLQVKLNNPPEEYMTAQNEGFTPTKVPIINKKDKLVFIPNKTGVSVPARKWFGIPKTYQEGGTKYNELLKRIADSLEKKFGSIIKGG